MRISILLAVAIAILIAPRCHKDSAFIPELTHMDQVKGADATLRQFTAEAFRKGELLWKVAAAEGYIVQVKDETYLFEAHIAYYETDKKSKDYGKATVVTAKRCVLQQGSKFMTVTGNVLVEAPRGRKLKTEELYWDEAKNQLYSNVPVTVQDASGNTLTGTRGIVTDKSLSRTVFKGGVGSGSTNF
jgi:LPS export ABC transporter protein LptC